MQPIVNLIEVLLIVSGLFLLAAAATDGRRPRWAGSSTVAHLRDTPGPAVLTPRTIRRTSLD